LVQAVSVAGAEHPAPQALEMRVGDDRLHQPDAEPLPALLLEHEDIGDVGEGGVVGDDAGEADLGIAAIDAEHERVRDRPLELLARDAGGPVRTLAQEGVRDIEVDARGVRADDVLAASPLVRRRRHRRCSLKNASVRSQESSAAARLYTSGRVSLKNAWSVPV